MDRCKLTLAEEVKINFSFHSTIQGFIPVHFNLFNHIMYACTCIYSNELFKRYCLASCMGTVEFQCLYVKECLYYQRNKVDTNNSQWAVVDWLDLNYSICTSHWCPVHLPAVLFNSPYVWFPSVYWPQLLINKSIKL